MELEGANMKQYCAQHCDCTKQGMWACIQEGLRRIDVEGFGKMAEHCHHNMKVHWATFEKRKWGAKQHKKRRGEEEEGV